jgi:hypothetical protein
VENRYRFYFLLDLDRDDDEDEVSLAFFLTGSDFFFSVLLTMLILGFFWLELELDELDDS